MNQHKTATAGVAAFALMLIASPSQAASVNLVTNGSFEQTTPSVMGDFNGGLRVIPNTSNSGLSGWTTASQWALAVSPSAIPGVVDTTQNGGPDLVTASPDGGNFITMDGDSTLHGALTQTVSGLITGDTYNLSFYSALGQQAGKSGQTWDWMAVTLGGSQQNVWNTGDNAYYLTSEGFTGWQQFNLTFTATASSEVLSFLANGGPVGSPPLTLLDGVSLTDVTPTPLPAALFFVAPALAGVFGFSRRKQDKA
ncbi:MAG: hypothetical protein DM484_30045 [Candidatus Methylumidiphilus alinenensis]|uniref:DUF642 domain-containing protein n=1 Tax=Candidatus Methylumidiphilus alinenensis TaxID=2202197 RepID=A0A2W4Q9S3_9GAMM|nr:MAG: hypothetical protein DM484_30045 [Candidatus Methylumidiphilus alinenensis]